MTADVGAALKQRPSLHVGIVQDGAHEMWNRTREGLQALRDQGRLSTWLEAIDRYHLMEQLGEALKIVEPDGTDQERQAQLDHWRHFFDTDEGAIDCVEGFLTLGRPASRGHERKIRKPSTSDV